ncbi:MAG: GAF domain-containing protein [Deltaproteobacteria bacterium]|nr:GAF domain-containing protein [Deltaproteobacteria bacterium]
MLDRFELLNKAIRISNSTIEVDRRLKGLLELFRRELGVDRAYLFNLDRESGTLTLRATNEEGQLPDLTMGVSSSFIGQTIQKRTTIIISHDQLVELPEAYHALFGPYQTMASFPIMDDQVLYGVLLLMQRTTRKFSPEEVALVETIAVEMAGTIRNFRLYSDTKKRIADLSVLYEVSRAVISTLELDHVLNTVVNITSKFLLAEGCALNVMDLTTNSLLVAAEFGHIPASCSFKHLLSRPNGFPTPELKYCVARKSPYFGPAIDDPECPGIKSEGANKSVICLPLVFKSHYRGTLCVYNKIANQPGRLPVFNREDLDLLTTMGTMISSSLENALTFQAVGDLARNNELLVRNLSCLYEISGAMMTTVKMDELLSIISKALTISQGLGFDRTLILVMNENEDSLMGAAMAEVKPEDRETNGRTLSELLRLAQTPPPLTEMAKEFLRIRLPLTEDGGILVRTVREKSSFNILFDKESPMLDKSLPSYFGRYAFATVPMLAKGKVVGVVAVDRDFSRNEITEEDMRNLSMLANQAGLAIENSRLYEYIEKTKSALSQTRERLIEAEKLAALGELASGMAHEIRNPLVSIGGFARRLLKGMQEDSPQRVYVQVIINEVTRLEKILGEVLHFTGDAREHVREHNLNDIIIANLLLLQKEIEQAEIEVVKELADVPTVMVDAEQINNVMINLFSNATQAMGRCGRLTVKTYSTHTDDRDFVACEISDTGPGIPVEVLPNIFNPFFTTKDSGTGLGLSIVHKTIMRHFGEIDVTTRHCDGTTFRFTLPVAAQAGLYLK